MKDYTKIRRGDDNRLYHEDGTEVKALFPLEEWNSKEAYAFSNIKGYEPMTAKELDREEDQQKAFNDNHNIIEEKFDGTRGIVQFFSQEVVSGEEVGYCRVFSRRISKKTGFYAENTDSVPQIRDINVPELAGTVLDGELFINGQPFKEVSSTLNCLWDKAVDRQIEKGFISLHAFDIIKYKGIDLRRMSLIRRKEYLRLAVEEANSPYIELVPFYSCGKDVGENTYKIINTKLGDYSEDIFMEQVVNQKDTFKDLYNSVRYNLPMTPKAFYEFIVSIGGEGVIIKSKEGRYHHKRGREYQKIKKFLTREVIIMGFTEPTDLYTGKFPKDRWEYWIDKEDNRMNVNWAKGQSAKGLLDRGYTPVTRFHYYNLIGNIRYGVIITEEEKKKLPKSKKFNIETLEVDGVKREVLEVGDCAGFDDDTRNYFTNTWLNEHNEEVTISPENLEANKKLTDKWDKVNFIGSVIEVKANEIFKDTGKLRHPRFLRMRNDKNWTDCTFKDHIQ